MDLKPSKGGSLTLHIFAGGGLGELRPEGGMSAVADGAMTGVLEMEEKLRDGHLYHVARFGVRKLVSGAFRESRCASSRLTLWWSAQHDCGPSFRRGQLEAHLHQLKGADFTGIVHKGNSFLMIIMLRICILACQ